MTFEVALLAAALAWPSGGNIEGIRITVAASVAAGSRPAAAAATVLEYGRTGGWRVGVSGAVAREVTRLVDVGIKRCQGLGMLGGISWALGRGCAPTQRDAEVAAMAWRAYGEAKRSILRSGHAGAAPSAPRAYVDKPCAARRPKRLTTRGPDIDNRGSVGIRCTLAGCRTWGLK